jgi:glycosyltransferase involved in cell wall biosynthesis
MSLAPASSEHILASVADPGAGPSHSVVALAAALARRGARVGLHTVAGWRDGEGNPEIRGHELTLFDHTTHPQSFATTPLLRSACLSAEMRRALRRSARDVDILHSHGLWLAPNLYPARAARQGRARFVASPRGMLGPEALAFSRRRKRLVWTLFQRDALRRAACLHATSEAELADIRAAGLTNPVAVIPNGVDLPALDHPELDRPVREAGEGGVVLSLGRIHPKKGLESLVRAWAPVEAAHPAWRLRIVGPAELDHDKALLALGASLGLTRLSIEPPAYGPERQAAYAEADLFVLPTLNENFAMTVAEALAAELPVISTKGAPWAGLEIQGCGWWIDHGPEPLAAALDTALRLPPETRAAMGARGRAWMARDFAWDRVAADMQAVYDWLTRGGSAPSTVMMD